MTTLGRRAATCSAGTPMSLPASARSASCSIAAFPISTGTPWPSAVTPTWSIQTQLPCWTRPSGVFRTTLLPITPTPRWFPTSKPLRRSFARRCDAMPTTSSRPTDLGHACLAATSWVRSSTASMADSGSASSARVAQQDFVAAARLVLPGENEQFVDGSSFHSVADDSGQEHLTRRRVSCCYYFKVAEDGSACTTCPRTSDAERVKRVCRTRRSRRGGGEHWLLGIGTTTRSRTCHWCCPSADTTQPWPLDRLAPGSVGCPCQTVRERRPRVPPRWFVRLAWYTHRALYRVTGGRVGLWRARSARWGTLRLTTTGRRTHQERSVILGYLDDGPNLVTMAMNGWADGEPAWWLNLQAHPDARADLADGPRSVRARAAAGAERTACGPSGVRLSRHLTATRLCVRLRPRW